MGIQTSLNEVDGNTFFRMKKRQCLPQLVEVIKGETSPELLGLNKDIQFKSLDLNYSWYLIRDLFSALFKFDEIYYDNCITPINAVCANAFYYESRDIVKVVVAYNKVINRILPISQEDKFADASHNSLVYKRAGLCSPQYRTYISSGNLPETHTILHQHIMRKYQNRKKNIKSKNGHVFDSTMVEKTSRFYQNIISFMTRTLEKGVEYDDKRISIIGTQN